MAWRTKLLDLLADGTEGVTSCACGREDNTAGNSCCQSQSGIAANTDCPSTVGEETEVSVYVYGTTVNLIVLKYG